MVLYGYLEKCFIIYTYIASYESNPSEGYILTLLFLIFFSLLSIIIFNILIQTDKIFYNSIYILVIDSIVIVLFNFLWLKDEKKLIALFVEAVVISIYLPICQIYSKEYNEDENLAFCLIIFDYGVWYVFNCIVYALIIHFCTKKEHTCES